MLTDTQKQELAEAYAESKMADMTSGDQKEITRLNNVWFDTFRGMGLEMREAEEMAFNLHMGYAS